MSNDSRENQVINFGAIIDALEGLSNDIRPEVEYLSKLIYEYADHIDAAQSRHEAEREALVRKRARYEELIREVIATDEAAVKELEAMNLGGVAEPTLTAKLRHALSDSGSQGLTDNQRAAVEFYRSNPSAAEHDLQTRLRNGVANQQATNNKE
jgi:hypothetical protein